MGSRTRGGLTVPYIDWIRRVHARERLNRAHGESRPGRARDVAGHTGIARVRRALVDGERFGARRIVHTRQHRSPPRGWRDGRRVGPHGDGRDHDVPGHRAARLADPAAEDVLAELEPASLIRSTTHGHVIGAATVVVISGVAGSGAVPDPAELDNNEVIGFLWNPLKR